MKIALAKFFNLWGEYMQHFNFNDQLSGTLWVGRYRATIVDSELYLLKLMHYIELNPVHTKKIDDYFARFHRFLSISKHRYLTLD